MTDVISNTPDGVHPLLSIYVERGWGAIPLHWVTGNGMCSCADGPSPCVGESAGKHPLRKGWTVGTRLSFADLHAIWSEETPHANVGIRTGVISGFWVLDVDPKNGGFASLQRLQAEIGVLPATYVVRTGSGGYHYYFTLPDFPIRNGAGRELQRRYGPGLDVRGDGGQVVAPPSRTAQGAYVIQVDVPLAAAPDALLALFQAASDVAGPDTEAIEDLPAVADLDDDTTKRVQAYAEHVVDIVTAEYRDAPPGQGNDTLFRSACSAIEIAQAPWNTITLLQIHHMLHDAARTRRATHPYSGGQSDGEFEQVWRSARSRTVGQARALPADRRDGTAFDPFAGTPMVDPFTKPAVVRNPEVDTVDAPDDVATTETITPPTSVTVTKPAMSTVKTVDKAVEPLPTLSEEFYDQREWLTRLRQIAHERMVSPDAVLGSYLAIVASQMPAGLHMDTSIGTPLTASLYVIPVGASGQGKTSGAGVAQLIYSKPVKRQKLSTGEGLIETFWGLSKTQDPDTLKFTTERTRISTNELFVLDEGKALMQLASRVGNITGEVLRTAWSGGDIGQNNATAERTRGLDARTYNLGLIMGMQNEVVADLLHDTATGMAQRFLLFNVTNPNTPLLDNVSPFGDVLSHPLHSEYVQMAPPAFIGGSPSLDLTPMSMGLEESIRLRLRKEQHGKVTGRVVVDELDAHRPSAIGKLAMVLTYLDGANKVTEDTWELATCVYDNSAATRDQLLDMAAERVRDEKLAAAQEKAREKQAIGRYGADQVTLTRTVLSWIDSGRNTRRAITQNAKGARRELLADVLAQMVKLGHLKEVDVGNRRIVYERLTDWMP